MEEVIGAYGRVLSCEASIEFPGDAQTERTTAIVLADGRLDVRVEASGTDIGTGFRHVQRVNRDRKHVREVGRDAVSYSELALDTKTAAAWSAYESRVPWASVARHVALARDHGDLAVSTSGDCLAITIGSASITLVFCGEDARLVSVASTSNGRTTVVFEFDGFSPVAGAPPIPSTITMRIHGLSDIPELGTMPAEAAGRIVALRVNPADAEARVASSDLTQRLQRRDLATGDVFSPDGRLLYNEEALDERIRGANNPRRAWYGWLIGMVVAISVASLILRVWVVRRKGPG
ncbi:MAG: hypothetical protein IT439_11420 [Phycisphaerales bacterium]|nr:hypothetical protein [Phycisphaerales bacterium]